MEAVLISLNKTLPPRAGTPTRLSVAGRLQQSQGQDKKDKKQAQKGRKQKQKTEESQAEVKRSVLVVLVRVYL